MVMGPDGDCNQERLCWREPSAIYWTGLASHRSGLGSIPDRFMRYL
jgi:hypothetical protein